MVFYCLALIEYITKNQLTQRTDMNEVDRINDNGFANGWHAQQLLKDSQAKGATMANLWNEKTKGKSAFNVYARCTKVTSNLVHYEFLDKSTVIIANINFKK